MIQDKARSVLTLWTDIYSRPKHFLPKYLLWLVTVGGWTEINESWDSLSLHKLYVFTKTLRLSYATQMNWLKKDLIKDTENQSRPKTLTLTLETDVDIFRVPFVCFRRVLVSCFWAFDRVNLLPLCLEFYEFRRFHFYSQILWFI